MRKTDISKYTEKIKTMPKESEGQNRMKVALKLVWKAFITVVMVFVAAFVIVGISMIIYLIGLANEPTGIDLQARAMNLTSIIYCENQETGEFEEYQKLYGTENRIYVEFKDIPEAMKDAVIAIEDKRFKEHNGVDWVRTSGAILNLAAGQSSYGGSTLTQQLIKNITDDDEVSLTRKLREIFRALKVEQEYTKDQILESYLNVVNFGNNCQGVQAAAELYFDKDIGQCSIAECAAIAGITQNPSKWNPLIYPDNNKKRRETVLDAMYEQEKITEAEYKQAKEESKNMEFVGYTYDDDEDDENDANTGVNSWYSDTMYFQLLDDLMKEFNITESAASDKLYTEGLNIYCAVDTSAQEIMEKVALDLDRSEDPDLQVAMSMIDFNGRLLATVGSADVKEGSLLLNMATTSRQPGSAIKPILSYAYAVEKEEIHFSSTVEDKKLTNWYGVNEPGPNNWYRSEKGNMLVPDAIEISSNCIPGRLVSTFGARNIYDQAVTLMGFENLDPVDDAENLGALSIGGTKDGVTAQEMAAAYAFIGNGGRYYKPYTYYYVTDANGKIILDNRDNVPKQAYSAETAAIINRLLRYNISNSKSTNAYLARIDGWDIVGKTGTTDNGDGDEWDSWFCGLSPYASLSVWTGYRDPEAISTYGQKNATNCFNDVMSQFLAGKEKKEFNFPGTILEREYCAVTGDLATSGCSSTHTGYYTEENMPGYCYGGHGGGSSQTGSGDDDEDEETTSGEDPANTDETTAASSEENTSESSEEQTEADTTASPDPTDDTVENPG